MQFCAREVEYVGFVVGNNGVRPTGTMLQSIQDFPRPKDISGVRAFLGLVEQVAWAFAKRDEMEPFRKLLGSKAAFLWTDELQGAFEAARVAIVRKVKDGVVSFKTGLRTALLTDWSKVGIAMAIVQKHCGCKAEGTVRCCPEGWKVCFTGSRFNSDAVLNHFQSRISLTTSNPSGLEGQDTCFSMPTLDQRNLT